MIYFACNIRRFFSKPITDGANWSKTWAVSKNKSFELEYDHNNYYLIGFTLDISMWRDHAGAFIGLDIFGHSFNMNFYDNRHWNRTEGKYADE